jgi:hypothetical protein
MLESEDAAEPIRTADARDGGQGAYLKGSEGERREPCAETRKDRR